MKALDFAESMGIDPRVAAAYIQECSAVVESEQYIATRKGNTVHVAADIKGLGGRQFLKDCRGTLYGWFKEEPTLYAPIRHDNYKAIRLARALGFEHYASTDTHVWLMQTKERFYGH